MGNGVLDAALAALKSAGVADASSADALMNQLYSSNPQVRQIVDQHRGQNIGDLLMGVGVDPSEARSRLGFPR